MYEPNCGLENVLLSWGHDEYLYRVLKHNKTKLPEQALNMIRFHSFYPWHTSGDYEHLLEEKDEETKKWVLKFKWVFFLHPLSGDLLISCISLQPVRFVHEKRWRSRYWKIVALLRTINRQIHTRRVGMVIFLLKLYSFIGRSLLCTYID